MTKYQMADIFLTDSDAGYAKVVKFLMQSPTLWHWIIGKILRMITGKTQHLPFIDDVKYYHAGMFLDEDRIIEQQAKVQIKDAAKVRAGKYIILRKLSLTDIDRTAIAQIASFDLGKGYDIPLIFGKTLTWLTGIRFFTHIVQCPGKEICVSRVAYWYDLDDHFGKKSWHEVTTDDIEDWARSHPEDWMIVEEV